MSKRVTSKLLFVLVALTASLAAGCGGQKSGEVALSTVSMFGESDSAGSAYMDLIEGFSLSVPNVKVEDSSETSTEEWKQGVTESFKQEETTPDVLFYFTGPAVREMILANQLVSVEEIREVYPDYASNIRESSMEFMQEFDGNHYAVPVKGFWEGLFCNKDLFDRYNAPLPTDWNSLLSAIEVFNENGIVPIAASLKEIPHYWIEHLVLSEGGAIEHRLNPKDYVPESWVKGIDRFRELYELSAFPANTTQMLNEETTALFMDKKAAMILDGSWLVQGIADPDNTVVLPIPVAPGGKMERGDVISGYSSGFYITRKAWDDPKKRDAAISFVNYMTTAQSIAALCEQGGAPAADIPQGADNSLLQTSAAELQQNAQNACMPIDSKLYKDAWQYLCGAIAGVATGDITAREAVTQVSVLNEW